MTDRDHRDRLVHEHLDLVRGVAAKLKRSYNLQVPLDDLVGYGMQGLIEAADRFEDGRGATFSTFAFYRIKGAILDGMRTMGWYGRADVARHRAAERANEYLQAEADAAAVAGPEGDPGTTAALVAITDALSAVASIHIVSLELGGEEQPLPDTGSPSAEERLQRGESAARVRAAIESLPEKERALMRAFYFEDRTLLDAGAELGLSKSWACRLHARAIKLLRKRLTDLRP